MDNPVSSINFIVSWIATIGVTSYIHGPSINGHLHYSHYLTIHGPSMDGPCLPPSVKLSVDGPQLLCPSMDHPWMNTLPTTFCQSIHGCHSYCAINVPSIDGHLGCHLLSKYPWMPQLLCPSMDHPWMNTLPTTFCQSIRGCHSYCAIHGPSMDGHLGCHLLSKYPWMPQLLCHPWTIHGWTPCLPPSVKVSVDATVTVSIHGPSMDGNLAYHLLSKYPWMPQLLCPSMDHPWMNTLPITFCQSIRGCHSYCAIHGPSMDGHLGCHLLSKYPWMPQLLCHPWTIHGWTPWLPPSVKVSVDATVTVPSMDHPWMDTLAATFCQSIRGCHSYCAIHGPSMDGHLGCHLLSKYPWMPQLLCHPWTIHG